LENRWPLLQDESVSVLLNGFGTVISALNKRAKPYLPQINGTIKWRLNHKLARTRQQAADLISRIAVVMKACNEEKLLTHLGVVLYEIIGEEYPEVCLSSYLGFPCITHCFLGGNSNTVAV
jgi:splicing factor 3B subunit 1